MHGSSTQKFFTVLQVKLPLLKRLDLVTTKDASCINLSIAKEQLKGKLTVVPIKNPDDHEMLKIIIQVLKVNTT